MAIDGKVLRRSFDSASGKSPDSQREPRNRPAAHVVGSRNLRERLLAMIATPDRFALLVGGELGRRPIFTPRALARSRPSPVRARINSRSNSASPPSTVSIRRPCAVVVSAHVSCSERKLAPWPVIVASVGFFDDRPSRPDDVYELVEAVGC